MIFIENVRCHHPILQDPIYDGEELPAYTLLGPMLSVGGTRIGRIGWDSFQQAKVLIKRHGALSKDEHNHRADQSFDATVEPWIVRT